MAGPGIRMSCSGLQDFRTDASSLPLFFFPFRCSFSRRLCSLAFSRGVLLLLFILQPRPARLFNQPEPLGPSQGISEWAAVATPCLCTWNNVFPVGKAGRPETPALARTRTHTHTKHPSNNLLDAVPYSLCHSVGLQRGLKFKGGWTG